MKLFYSVFEAMVRESECFDLEPFFFTPPSGAWGVDQISSLSRFAENALQEAVFLFSFCSFFSLTQSSSPEKNSPYSSAITARASIFFLLA